MSRPFPPFPGSATDPEGVFELSWELFGELARVLALKVARDWEPEIVIGVATAGVLPAATVASILRADFFAMKISRRRAGSLVREQPEVFSPAPPQVFRRRVLIIDEITTSGDTLRLALAAVREVGPAEVRTATSFVKPGGYRPDYYSLETGAMIVYPWDRQIVHDGELIINPQYVGAIED